jgi:basic membrane protein A
MIKSKVAKRIALAVGLVMVVALGVSSCGGSGGSSSNSGGSDFLGCVVSDAGGFQDKSFNESAKDGMDKAKSDLGIQVKEVESKNENDYEPNLKSAVTSNCNITFAVGFNLSDALKAQAAASPDSNFAIIDDNSIKDVKNVKNIVFDTAQASYLAGYLAAGYSKTGKVGTFGGMDIPSVDIFMDGFYDGVQKYNEDNKKNVQVIGWDKNNPKSGQFVAADGTGFTNQTAAKNRATTMVGQGVDVIMPVAGGAGLGVANVAQSNPDLAVIWVDTDGYVSQPSVKSVFLTSVVKEIGAAVETTVKDTKDSSFSNTPYVGTLANGGVGIAPYHDFDSKIDSSLKEKVNQISDDIKSGKIVVTSPNTPK